ncbi:hypothetical protein BC938DRAFT_477339 [Jimgerdemannia flammicorona]|uniref:F-box domain-containing protein n=1 Tax=Jimgerdemannia flammicorona TaxID=994334 RepID=A0A433QYV6_9FUNG|nr:hypothetical protein BC938DRAFT_477339 [Jimgerdemannia flammicorona]
MPKIGTDLQTILEPNPSCPRLPPEILYHIFSYFDLSSPENTDGVFDLMAASMVCREWCEVARPMITDEHIEESQFMDEEIDDKFPENLQRFASLLSTSKILGMNYCTKVNIVIIAINEFLGSPQCVDDARTLTNLPTKPEDHDALFTILALTTPTQLIVQIDKPAGYAPDRLHAREQFLSRLAPHFGVHALTLHLPRDEQPPDPQFASLVHVARASLSKVTLLGRPDPMTRDALSLCVDVRTASIFNGHAPTTDSILKGWRALRSINLLWPAGRVVETVSGMGDTLGDALEDIYVIGSPIMEEAEAAEVAGVLEAVVSRCARLERLYAGASEFPTMSFNYINDGVLRAMARNCKEIRLLDLAPGLGLTAAGIWDDETAPQWPKLRCLNVWNEQVVPEFVERVVLGCGALEEVYMVTEVSEDPGVMRAIEQRGFEWVCDRLWRRPASDSSVVEREEARIAT